MRLIRTLTSSVGHRHGSTLALNARHAVGRLGAGLAVAWAGSAVVWVEYVQRIASGASQGAIGVYRTHIAVEWASWRQKTNNKYES